MNLTLLARCKIECVYVYVYTEMYITIYITLFMFDSATSLQGAK